jgi:hypothetical protein
MLGQYNFTIQYKEKFCLLAGVFGAKATGEPAVLLGVSSLLAIRHALAAAKLDLGADPKEWFNLCKF